MDNFLIEIKNLEKIYKSENSFLTPKKEDNYVLKGVNLNIKKGKSSLWLANQVVVNQL